MRYIQYIFYDNVYSFSIFKAPEILPYSRYLFSDDGKVLKVVSIPKENWETEEIILEELSVFQVITFFAILFTLNLILFLQCLHAICWPAT